MIREFDRAGPQRSVGVSQSLPGCIVYLRIKSRIGHSGDKDGRVHVCVWGGIGGGGGMQKGDTSVKLLQFHREYNGSLGVWAAA